MTQISSRLIPLFLFLFIAYTSAQSGYVYQEEFNGQGNWTRANNEVRELYVSNGKYYFEHKYKTGSRDITTRTFNLNQSKDFEIETSILKISGEQDYGMSFLFDYRNSGNYKEFGITSTGYFRVAEAIDNSFGTIKNWTSSPEIKQGNYATNKLKIVKKGNRLLFYINGSRVHGINARNFVGNKIAFRLYRDQKVAIDYFRVKYTGGSTTTNNNSSSKTILFDGFNSNENDWPTKYDDKIRLAVVGGNYIIDHKRDKGGYAPTIKKYIDESRNFRIVAQIKKVSGDQYSGFGLIFGQKDIRNQNYFLISANGSFRISKAKNGKLIVIKDWTKSPEIKTGNSAVNYLKVQKVGTRYKFYINNKFVHSSYSVEWFGSNNGFSIYNKQKISIGYLSMAYEDQQSTIKKKTSHSSTESILFDSYSDNRNNWSTLENEKVDLNINNGAYIFDHRRPSSGFSSTIVQYINTSRDFKILAEIKKISGIQNHGYGIVFGRQDSNNQNLFYINGQGSYSILKMKNGETTYIRNWTQSNSIRTGNGNYNILKVVKVDNQLEYYINNTKVHTAYNPEFFGSRLGYIVYHEQKISIPYLSVGYLD